MWNRTSMIGPSLVSRALLLALVLPMLVLTALVLTALVLTACAGTEGAATTDAALPADVDAGTGAGTGAETGAETETDTETDTDTETEAETKSLTEVTLMLDWVPNTNHTGVFVADDKGYFADAGLDVTIIQPGEVMAQQAVAGGAADFGIDFQEQVTMARADDRPLVSVAAIIQHNTSGFASPVEHGAKSPRDWDGMTYGAWGSPFESPTLRVMMDCDEGDFDALEVVNTGFADPLALMAEGQTDLAWIFYGWQGIQAEQNDLALDVVMMDEWFECVPDYYTPVVIASEQTIAERPELVRAFVGALSRGYVETIADPDGAAVTLLNAAPELDRDLVETSQSWLSPRYQAEAVRWGEQSRDVWADYAQWMVDNGIIDEMIDVDAVFTNEFLP